MSIRKIHQPIQRINGKYNNEYQRFIRARRVRWINKYKLSKGCEICGYNLHHVALDFDHINPETKLFSPSVKASGTTIKKLISEMRKCRILCANCHRIYTLKTRVYKINK